MRQSTKKFLQQSPSWVTVVKIILAIQLHMYSLQ